ncbi:trigger factor [Magnetospira sp. QH-2]|uniref:trigger factor n=1 Tax=Magnetospira sp. (strain QH-2) TaxID=1288970 RepID=UPI0003E81010|nr:trigger factor [Magnetospira sp. QH-2]CCQ73885.1 Trigger factor (TF), molecular chaperone involved in cell division [Magnetospira sp. QH-2]
MQATETLSEGLKREYKIVVPASELDQKVTARLKDAAKTMSLPGFRPGKVPVSLLKQRFGKSVMGEVLEETVNESSQKTMTDNELRPVMQPQIEIVSFDEGKDLEYTMAVELFPEFEPMDFASLSLERMVADIDEGEVDSALERLSEAYKESQPVKSKARKAKKDDVLVIDFTGRLDGEEFPGGKAEDYNLELGSGTFIPGFEDQLIGSKAGEEKDVNVTFPEDYGAENLAGKEVVFSVVVKEIRETAPAAIDDELAKKAGKETLDELKQAIRDEQGKEYGNYSRAKLKRTLLDALADGHSFEVPAGMLEAEAKAVAKSLQDEANAAEGVEPPAEGEEAPEPEVTDEHREIAERRVRLGLLLAEVGRLNNIEVTPDDVNKALMSEASRYPGQEKMVMDFYRQNPQMMEQIKAPIFEDKVCDYVIELAKVTDKPVSIEELMRDPDEEDAPKAEAKPAKKKAAPKKKAAKKEAATEEAPES